MRKLSADRLQISVIIIITNTIIAAVILYLSAQYHFHSLSIFPSKNKRAFKQKESIFFLFSER